MPDVLIGDRVYDSDDLNDNLCARGVKLVSPHKKKGRRQNTGWTRTSPLYKGAGLWIYFCLDQT